MISRKQQHLKGKCEAEAKLTLYVLIFNIVNWWIAWIVVLGFW